MKKVLWVLGLSLLLLPAAFRACGEKWQRDVISTYEQQVDKVDENDRRASIEAARDYNTRLFEEGWLQKADYTKQLNLVGIMGSLHIPKIGLKLPIRHGTSEEVLASCVGHLLESSLPVGGENTHSVLTSHRGVPNAQLFTRLDELKKGDSFFLSVCGEELHYKVCQMQTVKPEDVQAIQIRKGRDLVSLVTCTPYGLNTHRLIVTGERVVDQSERSEAQMTEKSGISKWDGIPILIAMFFLLAGRLPGLMRRKKKRRCYRKESRDEKMDRYSSCEPAVYATDRCVRGKRKHRGRSPQKL